MTAVQKTFGVLILLLGAALLIAGVGAAIYGAMDQQDHEEDQGPLGIGEDEQRSEANQGLIAGGLISAGLGVALAIVGLVLLVAARPKQQQQQVVVAGGTGHGADPGTDYPGFHDPSDNDPYPEVGGQGRQPAALVAVAAIVVLALVAVGLALSAGPGGPLGGGDAGTGPLDQRAADGEITFAGTLLGQSQNAYEWELSAPQGTRLVQATLDWEPADEQSQELRVTIQVQDGTAWRNVKNQVVAPGGMVQGVGEAGQLDAAKIRVVVSPVEQSVIVSQTFTIDVAFYA